MSLDFDTIEAEIAAERETLHNRRSALSIKALEGDTDAVSEIESIRVELIRLDLRASLVSIGRDAQAQKEMDEAERAAARDRERSERNIAKLETIREKSLHQLQVELAGVSTALVAFISAEAELQNASVQAGRRFVSRRETAAELMAVCGRDAGLGEPLPYVRNSVRASLLERYPPRQRGEAISSSERCSVCAHDRCAEIDSDLLEGVALRELEERYGVSRSSLHRHTQHGV